MNKIIFFGVANLVLLNYVRADDIYYYKDKAGITVYSNKPVANSQKLDLPPLSVYAKPMNYNDFNARGYTKAPNSQNINPSNAMPSIPMNAAEKTRQQILQAELEREQQALKTTQQALNLRQQTPPINKNTVPDQLQNGTDPLQDALIVHQKNIELLSKQLGLIN